MSFDNVFQLGLQFGVNIWMQINVRTGETIVLRKKKRERKLVFCAQIKKVYYLRLKKKKKKEATLPVPEIFQ